MPEIFHVCRIQSITITERSLCFHSSEALQWLCLVAMIFVSNTFLVSNPISIQQPYSPCRILGTSGYLPPQSLRQNERCKSSVSQAWLAKGWVSMSAGTGATRIHGLLGRSQTSPEISLGRWFLRLEGAKVRRHTFYRLTSCNRLSTPNHTKPIFWLAATRNQSKCTKIQHTASQNSSKRILSVTEFLATQLQWVD